MLFVYGILLLYFSSLLLHLVYLAYPRERFSRYGMLLILLGGIFHLVYLTDAVVREGRFIATTLSESLLIFSLLLVFIYLIIQRFYSQPVLGSIFIPVVILLFIFGLTSSSPAPKEIKGWWFPLHIIFTYAGYSFFLLAFLTGVLYIVQERKVKKKHLGAIFHKLPPLTVMDEINLRCITLGFPLLTLGIITGAIGAEMVWGTYWTWDPKQVWSLIIWLLYAGLLHTRLVAGWRGQKIAIASISIFLILLFTFIGVNYLMPGLHRF
ncbi:MAG TPA: cytochrome c biogenesis protein CcsA [bacterium]